MIFILVLLSTLLLIYLFHLLYWKRRNLPPGPTPLPKFGNWLSMVFPLSGYECFRRWTKKYGDVYTFWLESEPYIIIGSYERMKETFIRDGDTYVNKKFNEVIASFRDGQYGVVDTNGEFWSTHRRFTLSNFRDLGFGKDLMQQKILIEVQEIIRKFDENVGEEQNVPKVFNKAVANVINQLIFGNRFDDEKEKEFQKLMDLLEYQQKAFTSWKIIVECVVPFLSRFMPKPTVADLIEEYKTSFYGFFNRQIEEHRLKIDFDSEENESYAESYLKEQRKREADGDKETFSTQQLSNMCMDLWLAGLGTTTLTLGWSMAYVMNTPGVQEKMHEELDRVIGSDRLISTSDKNDLPYMQAVINECQRCANIVPINLFHETTRDTVIAGYPIEKGTGVIAQISTVMLDETIFPDPYKFNPDRFIDEHGKLKKVEELCPFSVGKRQCLGEGLARMELFLMLANFFHRYEISPSSTGPPSIDKTQALRVTPREFDAVLTKRH
ncbi:Protein CBG01242 [Caenorhabditis briggsae]|uniref:Protein CBG01242 n=1 Tax=Caenorhabditis briggsae TaxID=6238 RepID=A8WPX6_CAEBR|nr:Protein CBG01242 [Caenorhabditis briggsae]CAP22534.1 Protein CBG01242 [Caenorhabditis briggsae]